MATLIKATSFKVNSKTFLSEGKVLFKGGETLTNIPTVIGLNGSYVNIANLWLRELAQHLKDISSNARALRSYWDFLESNDLKWDNFLMPKSHKPTYRWRNKLKKLADAGQFSYKTANKYVSHVVSFYKWAIQNNHIRFDNILFGPFVFQYIKVPSNDGTLINVQTTDLRIRVPNNDNDENFSRQTLHPLFREEIILLAKVLAESRNDEFRLIIGTAISTGMRVGEVTTFPISLIYRPPLATKRIEVNIGPKFGVSTKFGKERTIEMPTNLMMSLFNYSISERRIRRLENSYFKNEFEPLFITQRGNNYTRCSINKLWSDMRGLIQNTHNVTFGHKPHDTRSTYGTYRLESLLNNGIPPADALKLIKGWMGHKSVKDTWNYIRFLEERKIRRESMAMLDSLMEGAIHYPPCPSS